MPVTIWVLTSDNMYALGNLVFGIQGYWGETTTETTMYKDPSWWVKELCNAINCKPSQVSGITYSGRPMVGSFPPKPQTPFDPPIEPPDIPAIATLNDIAQRFAGFSYPC